MFFLIIQPLISYSGSDISTIVRDALMEPIRKVQSATHFKWVEARPSNNDTGKTKKYLTPCSPGAPNAIEMTWVHVKSEELLEPDLTVKDFMKAVRKSRPTVNQKDIEEQIKFTNDFGKYSSHSIFVYYLIRINR